MTPDLALARLVAGNVRFVAGAPQSARDIAEWRSALLHRQQPFAMILSCADSRVPPELVFDQRLGDLFVCRVAGNILEAGGLGSFEYAVSVIGSPAVLLVLGHQGCGAVTAAVERAGTGEAAPGSIQTIVDALAPAIAATPRGALPAEAYIDAVVRANARRVARDVRAQSALLDAAVIEGRLAVHAGHYALDSGQVTLLDA